MRETDKDQFFTLAMRMLPQLVRVANRYVKDKDDAHDIAINAIMEVYQGVLQENRLNLSVGAALMQTLQSRCIDHLKRKKALLILDDPNRKVTSSEPNQHTNAFISRELFLEMFRAKLDSIGAGLTDVGKQKLSALYERVMKMSDENIDLDAKDIKMKIDQIKKNHYKKQHDNLRKEYVSK